MVIFKNLTIKKMVKLIIFLTNTTMNFLRIISKW